MVGQRLEAFLQSCSLEARDIPKVVGLWLVTKYSIGVGALAFGLRYQPLRQVVLRKSLVLQRNPWAQQQRLRLFEAWDKAKKYPSKQVIRRAVSGDVGQPQVRSVKASLRDAKRRVKDVARRRLLHVQMVHQRLTERARHSWHGWTSRKYWQLADKLQEAAEKNQSLSWLSALVGTGPKALALGMAEGVLLAKLVMPVTAPMTLLLIVQMFKKPVVKASEQEFPDTEESDSHKVE
mmetsp:Transcript_93393/g.171380  ORF Transcript_93393/g.171380 Transcript_93393/m.171380 type:complete len:235 (-) Transcript_93393:87-791(-)